jgi:hypothetical protein
MCPTGRRNASGHCSGAVGPTACVRRCCSTCPPSNNPPLPHHLAPSYRPRRNLSRPPQDAPGLGLISRASPDYNGPNFREGLEYVLSFAWKPPILIAWKPRAVLPPYSSLSLQSRPSWLRFCARQWDAGGLLPPHVPASDANLSGVPLWGQKLGQLGRAVGCCPPYWDWTRRGFSPRRVSTQVALGMQRLERFWLAVPGVVLGRSLKRIRGNCQA